MPSAGIAAVAEAVAEAARDDRLALMVYCREHDSAQFPQGSVEVIDAPDLITNEDDPVAAVRSRSQASIVRAAADVAAGAADALVSPGSTGATMAAATFAIKRAGGVQRPALAVQIPAPGLDQPVVMLDAGASSEARAGHLIQFAYLGSAFATSVLGISAPRVGLLSVGAEQKKGTPVVQEAHQALRDARTPAREHSTSSATSRAPIC